jgi:hypothetical protein
MPFQAELNADNSDIRLFNMDVSELLTVSNFPAVLAITADSACVSAIRRSPRFLGKDYVELSAARGTRADPRWTGARHIDEEHQASRSRDAVGGEPELRIDRFRRRR